MNRHERKTLKALRAKDYLTMSDEEWESLLKLEAIERRELIEEMEERLSTVNE